MLDLQPFCGTDLTRWYLAKPFSKGEFSYATNGHILIRQPRRADVADLDPKAVKFNPDGPLAGIDEAAFYVPRFNLPPAPDGEVSCPICSGRGFAHDCPDCECECGACDTTGTINPERRMSVTIAGVFYALNYVRQMLALPAIEISNSASGVITEGKPMLFRFDGGVGALMPLHSMWHDHVDIEPAEGT